LGNDSPSFSAIATGVIGPGTWGFNLCLSLPNSGSPSVIASATGTNNTTLGQPYTFEADVSVVGGIPSGTYNLTVNNVSVASGSLSNFPLVPYPTRPANGPTATTTKIRRTLSVSLNLTQVGNPYSVFTTLFSDSFQRANENPLNPTNWGTFGSSFGFTNLQILNNECELHSVNGNSGNICQAAFPNDQWAEIKINHLGSSNSNAFVYVRTDSGQTSGYRLEIDGPADGTASATIQVIVVGILALFTLTNQVVNIGDVFRLVAKGTTISAYQNGVLLGSATDSTTASGSAAVRLSASDTLHQPGVINFNGGSVSNAQGNATCTLQVSEVTGYTGVPVTTNSN